MVRLRELTWPAAREALRDRVVLLPLGSVEQHGRHMPLATDHITAERIALLAEERHPVVVAPTLPYGISPHHRQFWGTLWVRSDLFRDFVLEIARSFKSHGVTRIVGVNGHGGNSTALSEVGQTLRQEGLAFVVFEWWRGIEDEFMRDLLGEEGASIGGHACAAETSVGLHLFPEWLAPEAAVDVPVGWAPLEHGGQVHFDTIDFTEHGNVGFPSLARREAGAAIIERAVTNLIGLIRWFESRPLPELLARPHVG
jgi:creatinine amidohydrolase